MDRFRKIALVVYLIAGIVVAGMFAGSLFGPLTGRFELILARPVVRLLVAVCLAVVALHLVATVVRLCVERPAPDCVHPGGNPDIEVSIEALASVACVAAADRDIMVESVDARVTGRERDAVRITVEAIAFTDTGLEGLAHRIQQRVADACESMLGTSGVTARVRFLPSKTVTKEVPGE